MHTQIMKKRSSCPPWSWRKRSEVLQPTILPIDNDKKYTVILWDASYRENLVALECLARQARRSEINFIFIEWSDKPNPKVLEYDFIDVYCMNLPIDKNVYPSYDTGIQLNLGLYLANTEWVTYLHCDFISDNQIEIIMEKTSELDDRIIYLEGHQINKVASPQSKVEYKQLLQDYGPTIDPYWYKENGRCVHLKPFVNGVLCTVRKEAFINLMQGFYWNHPRKNEVWTLSVKQKNLGLKTFREWLRGEKRAVLAQPDMLTYCIPHNRGAPKRREICLPVGGEKYYNDFVSDWLPYHEITHIQRDAR